MAATATASHSTSHLTPAPHRSPVHRFGWHDEGGALGLHLHCLHQPQEPFMGAKEVPPSPRTSGGGHMMGRQAQDVLCQSQVQSKVLSAIFGPSCPFFLCTQARGSPQPSLGPLRTVPGKDISRWEA